MSLKTTVFEDSLAGIQRAIAAGMQTVGVGNRTELAGAAVCCLDSYAELDPDTLRLRNG